MPSTPLPTTGITGGISETGIATIEVPVFVDTLAEALTVRPDLGILLPYRSRNFSQEDDGGFKVVLQGLLLLIHGMTSIALVFANLSGFPTGFHPPQL